MTRTLALALAFLLSCRGEDSAPPLREAPCRVTQDDIVRNRNAGYYTGECVGFQEACRSMFQGAWLGRCLEGSRPLCERSKEHFVPLQEACR